MKFYSPISRRIRALLIDGVLLAIWLFLAIISITNIGLASAKYEAILILFIVFSVEPFLVSLTGGTLGQHLCKIKVQSTHTENNINILFSYIRYLVKLPLGIFSLLTVTTTEHYQGIHDLLSRSVVVHKDPSKVPPSERLSQRTAPDKKYSYPSVLRRIFIIILYLLLSFITLLVASTVAISEACLYSEYCSKFESAINFFGVLFFYISVFVFFALGWQSRLWGCRKCLTKGK